MPEAYLLPIGIDGTELFQDLSRIKSDITALKEAVKAAGISMQDAFTAGATAAGKVASATVTATKGIIDQGAAVRNSNSQFQIILDQLTKITSQNVKAFDINALTKYFSSVKGGAVSLTDLAQKTGQTFDATKFAAFNAELQKSKGNFDDLKITLDFIKNSIGDLTISPEGATQLSGAITLLETQMTGAAERASEIGINLNNPQAIAALQAIQTEAAKTEIDFTALETAIKNGSEALKTLPADSPEFNTLSAAIQNATDIINTSAVSIDELKIKLQNLQAAAGAEKDLPTLVLLNRQIDETKDEIEKMSVAGSEGFDNLGNRIQTNTTQATTLLVQYRNLRNEIGQLKLTDQTNPKIGGMIAEAAILENTIKNTNRELRLASSNTAGFDAGIQAVQGLVGVFAAAQGAVALFDDKNEDLQKTLVKVYAAMAFLQGIQQVGQILAKESALNVYLEGLFREKDAAATDKQAVAQTKETIITEAEAKSHLKNAAAIEEENLAKQSSGGAVNIPAVAGRTGQDINAEVAAQNALAASQGKVAAATKSTAAAKQTESIATKGLAVADTELAGAEVEAAVGQEALNVAMLENPVGILFLAIGALVGAYALYSSTIGRASEAEKEREAVLKAMSEAETKAADSVAKEEGELNILLETAKNVVLQDYQRQNAIDKIRASYPEYLHDLSLDNIYTKESAGLIAKQIELIKERALVQAAQDVYIEKLKKVLEAEAELNRVRNGGATLGEKLKALLFDTGSSASSEALHIAVLADKMQNLNDATTEANGGLKVVDGTMKEFANTLQDNGEALDKYLDQFGVFKQSVSEPVSIKTTTAFDPKAFDDEKKKALDLAQYKLDVAVKGSAAELAARKALIETEHKFDVDDKRKSTDEQKVIEGKYLSDVQNINSEFRARSLKDATAFAQYKVLIAKEGTKEELDAQLKAIDVSTKESLAAVGIDHGEELKLIAEGEKKKDDLRRQFNAKELQDEIDIQKTVINQSVEGSQEAFVAKKKILELQANIEIINAKNNTDKILEIYSGLDRAIAELTKKTNSEIVQAGLNAEISLLNEALASVTPGTERELALKKMLVDEQALLEKNSAKSIVDATEREAKILEITAKANADKLALDHAFFQQEIELNLRLYQSELQIQKGRQQLIIDDNFSTQKQKYEARKELLRLEIEDNQKQQQALKDSFDERLDDRKEFDAKMNALIAQENDLKSQPIEPPKFTVAGFFDDIKDKIIQALTKDVNDPETKKKVQDAWGQLIGGAVSAVGSAFSELTSMIESQAQAQIDAIQSVIDELDQQITAQEDAVKQQQELSDKGLANDLGNQQALLDDLKAKKNEEIAAREQAQKKLEQFRKEEAVIQSASIVASNIEAGVNMINAASKIFKAHAGIPFAGVAIAIGLVALMVATFLAIKSAINTATTAPVHREGGGRDLSGIYIHGPSHENKGVGLYDNRTGKEIAQYEGKEYLYAIKREQTKKYLPLLEAINKDDLPIRNPALINDIIGDNAARIPMQKVREIIILQREVNNQKVYEIDFRKEDLDYLTEGLKKPINEFHKSYNDANNSKVERVDFGDYWLETSRGRTRKIWKKRS